MIEITALSSGVAGFTAGSLLTYCLRKYLERIFVVVRHAKSPEKLGSKMALIVRTDINMKPGKVASQCAHAAVSCYRASLIQDPELTRVWECVGQPKIVLRCDGETNFYHLEAMATKHKLIHVLIQDAGRTQLTAGTKTVLGIGPGNIHDMDAVTKHLKLY